MSQYLSENLNNHKKKILLHSYSHLSDIPLLNYFEIEYFNEEESISFKTKFQSYDSRSGKLRDKYLSYKDSKLSLQDDQFLFDVKLSESKTLTTNEPFLIKIRKKNKYLLSKTSSKNGKKFLSLRGLESTKEFSKIDHNFYFHLQKIDLPSKMSELDLDSLNNHAEKARKILAERESPEKSNQNYYNAAKEELHSCFKKFRDGQPNKSKVGDLQKM